MTLKDNRRIQKENQKKKGQKYRRKGPVHAKPLFSLMTRPTLPLAMYSCGHDCSLYVTTNNLRAGDSEVLLGGWNRRAQQTGAIDIRLTLRSTHKPPLGRSYNGKINPTVNHLLRSSPFSSHFGCSCYNSKKQNTVYNGCSNLLSLNDTTRFVFGLSEATEGTLQFGSVRSTIFTVVRTASPWLSKLYVRLILRGFLPA